MTRDEADGGGEMARVLPRGLSRRTREQSDAVGLLVAEAFREGSRIGSARFADELLHYVIERLAETERQYETLSAEQAEVIVQTHGGGSQPPVVEAYFGGVGAVLSDLRAEIRRLRDRGEG